ncbi:hypothetical protein WMF04_37595 [Sorangium sp. So ce260]|uniref:hypothetical protein n=1 Tax=Sorangium sp. So ce260 TaxID=3133291 RepID=UPI003F5E7AFE
MISAFAKRARARQATRIEEQDFLNEMPDFSAQRVFLLAQEVEAECPQIREIVESFAKIDYDYGSFKITAETVRTHLRSVPSMFSTTLFGRTLRPDNDDDMFELWRFLFELGLLNARVADSRQKDGFRHVFPQEDPGLVSRARWNAIQGIVWGINPAYRDFLIARQENESHRTGLPPRRFARRP